MYPMALESVPKPIITAEAQRAQRRESNEESDKLSGSGKSFIGSSSLPSSAISASSFTRRGGR